jgi:RNA polymerase sigma-70 factor (ECF subfamily)
VSIDSVIETLHESGDVGADTARDLERGLSSLSERQRQVLQAVSLEGYSAREAALRLRMSAVGVRVTLHRAVKALTTILTQGNS